MTTWPGHEAWVTRDYGSDGKALSMSKAGLGSFVYHLLRLGGHIHSTWAMGPQYDRTYVQMSISLPPGRREALQDATGVKLEKPPTVHLNNGRGGSDSTREPADPRSSPGLVSNGPETGNYTET